MAFVTTWTTTGVDETITIPCGDIGTYNATIDWGDSSPDSTITTFDDADLTHTYAVAGTYTVSITGTLPWVYFNNAGDKLKIKSIEEWGDVGVLSGQNSYFGCANLVGNATDTPDMSAVTNMPWMFRSAALFNGDISGWDVSAVTNMSHMLRGAAAFNQNISSWDVGACTNMAGMFFGATLFNQNIGGWDVSAVENMSYMFYTAAAFNQAIGSWDVGAVTDMAYMFLNATSFNQAIGSWDVSAVANMSHMLFGAAAFNQAIGSWNVSSVTNMESMFRNATSFNQNVGGWDVSGVVNMTSVFWDATAFDQSLCGWDIRAATSITSMLLGVTLSTANYDKTLIAWALLDVTDGLNFHGGNSEYCFGADARASLVADQTWTITDGGEGAGPCVDPGPCTSADFHMYKTDRIADGVGPVEASQLQGVLVR